MRILWASNAPYAPSGYGVQTKLVAPRIQGMGHEIAIACNWGLDSNVLTWPGRRAEIPLYPSGVAPHSVDVIGPHAIHHNADVVITHYDAWVYHPELMGEHNWLNAKPWCAWFPVDTDDICDRVAKAVRLSLLPIVQTRHGQESCEREGIKAAYVPAAYDPSEYHPLESSLWREKFGVGPDTFVAVMIAANKGADGAPSRKSFPNIIEGFSLFHKENPDSLLYLHTQPKQHLDLEWFAEKHGVSDCVKFAHGYFLHTGLYPPQDINQMLNGANVLLSPSMGEGVGVPIMEAQAAGTPVITGDWTSMSELTRTGLAIPKSDAMRYTINTYGDMWMVRPEAVRDALKEAATWQHPRAEVAAKISEYEVETVMGDYWVDALAELERRIKPAQVQPNRAERRKVKYSKAKVKQ